MDPITIGAFLASAASSLIGGFTASKAAKGKIKSAREAFQVEKVASKTRERAIEAQAKAAKDASQLEWKAGMLDLDTSAIEAQAVTAQASSDYFNVLIDSANTAFAYEADAASNEFNARVSSQMAKNAIDSATADARDYRLRGEAAIENRAAIQAGSGFMLQGSPLLVQDVLFGEVELGAARLKHAGEVEATRLRQQGELQLFNAKISRANANTARETGKINAGYVKEAAKIRMDAAFLSGDKTLLGLEGTLLTARNSQLQSDYLKIANKNQLTASRVQTKAAIQAAKTEGQASVASGLGNAFSTIASSGMFG